MSLHEAIAASISLYTKEDFHYQKINEISGGSINKSIKIDDGKKSWFVKINLIERERIFYEEMKGLKAIAKTKIFLVRIP